MKEILKEAAEFIDNTYGVDYNQAISIINKLNELYNNDCIELIEKVCPHSVLIEEKKLDEYDYCSQCCETIVS